MYFVILFVSPLYFAIRQKWGAFILNAFLYGFACLLILSLFFAWIGVFLWFLAVGHAGWHLRVQLMDEQAQLIAVRMSEQMRKREIESSEEKQRVLIQEKSSGSGAYLNFDRAETSPEVLTPNTFCSSCGVQALPDSKFCEECGQDLIGAIAH